jgi:hypothetical protein
MSVVAFAAEIMHLTKQQTAGFRSSELRAGVEAGRKKLIGYYEKVCATRAYVLAVMTDPRVNAFFDWAVSVKVTGNDENVKEIAEGMMKEAFEEYRERLGTAANVVKEIDFLNPGGPGIAKPYSTDSNEEWLSYRSRSRAPEGQDPLEFWEGRNPWPTIAAIGLDVQHIPATSAEVERLFSRHELPSLKY